VVGLEALQFLKATCLGRKALTTIHGGSVEEALMRLEQLALESAPELGLPSIRAMVATGLDVVALMGRVHRHGRVERTLQAIVAIQGLEKNGDYRLNYLYQADADHHALHFEEAFRKMISPRPVEEVIA
jgi:pilus assembly protein CpaF